MTTPRFELFIASRYLRKHRREKVISVITAISILGVAAGVMALVIALAVTNGFRDTLQRNLLGAMAHIDITAKNTDVGIENWRDMAARLRRVPHVTAVSPALYSEVYVAGAIHSAGVVLKGIDVDSELQISEMLRHLKAGSVEPLRDPNAEVPGIILGSRLVEDTGMKLNSIVSVTSPQGQLSPMGIRPTQRKFRIVGVFDSGFYQIDSLWAFTNLQVEQRFLSIGDSVNRIEVNVDNLDRVEQHVKEITKAAGPDYIVQTWKEQNQSLMASLNMERIVTIITIGLIEIVAALNIFVTLVMMVMEKYRDIGLLMSLGAKEGQIRRIFMLQGVLIGCVGSALGLILGYTVCYFASKYHWPPLDPTVYALSFVPFKPRPYDAFWIAAVAILVSFLATLYPARNATRIAPAEVMRYE
jgi:lipoprotein-releasing system permease protein